MSESQDIINLITAVKNKDEKALDELISINEGLIHAIIGRFKVHYDYDDLYQAAVMGFIKAIKKYDDSYDAKLTTYAFPVILGEVRQYIRDERMLKYNRNIVSISSKIEAATQVLTQKYMRKPTLKEITEHLGVTKDELLEALESREYILSMDQVYSNDEDHDATLHNYIVDENVKKDFDKIALDEELEKLDKNEKLLMKMRYNLDQTQVEVAKRLGVSQVKVSRMENKVIKNLKKRLQVS